MAHSVMKNEIDTRLEEFTDSRRLLVLGLETKPKPITETYRLVDVSSLEAFKQRLALLPKSDQATA